jgi:hypothetical protein
MSVATCPTCQKPLVSGRCPTCAPKPLPMSAEERRRLGLLIGLGVVMTVGSAAFFAFRMRRKLARQRFNRVTEQVP